MTDTDWSRQLAQVRCFLLDMDGTFYLGERLIEGSLDFLAALERTGRDAWFLTNNSSKSAQEYVRKLRLMGVPERFCQQVMTSGHAAAHYIQERFPSGKGFLLGNPALRAEMTEMGLRFTDEEPDYVLVAFDTTLDYAKMCRVCDLIRTGKPYIATHPDFNCPTETGFIPDMGAIMAFIEASTGRRADVIIGKPYIATHPDFNCPTETGFIPDMGAIMAFIEASTGRRADVIIGKPYGGIVQEALLRTGRSLKEMAMVGDRLYTDVATGVNHGMKGILVLSGEATMDDVAESDVKPDMIFDRLADMIPYL